MSKTDIERAYATIARAEQGALTSGRDALKQTIEALDEQLGKLPAENGPATVVVQTLQAARNRVQAELNQMNAHLTQYHSDDATAAADA